MKLKQDVTPSCHLREGKKGAAIWGGTFKPYAGYKSLLTLLITVFGVCSLIAVGAFALVKSLDAIRSFANSNRKFMKIFGLVLTVLSQFYSFLTEDEK